MIAFASPILDQHGRRIARQRQTVPLQSPKVDASYDAARTEVSYERHWENADHYDADSANSLPVREKLRSRSRYETYSNGFADGITQTYATDLIGKGPMLRVKTRSVAFNKFVEDQWYAWYRAIQLRRKLWCMAHAKVQDGEAFGIVVRNPRVRHRVKLDVELVECDQMSSPLQYFDEFHIDGLRFDRFGNPLVYERMLRHPGDTHSPRFSYETQQIPATLVAHWYKLRRPKQHRGIPERTSTLNVGASSRSFREATLQAAATAARFAALLKTQLPPEAALSLSPMSTLDIENNMMTALPEGWEATQLKAEHPSASYAEFMRSHVNEMARPLSMPYNKAACDSSSYNYASGRLDHQTYYAHLDTDRWDCDDLVMSTIYREWFRWAGEEFGWSSRMSTDRRADFDAMAELHEWNWPSHQVVDRQSEASADDKELKNGSQSLTELWHRRGFDFRNEVLPQLAEDYGVTVDDMQQMLLAANMNANHQLQGLQELSQGAGSGQETDENDAE